MTALGLLGEVASWTDGREKELGPARQRCVLAALLVEVNRVVPVARLVERVWGQQPPLRARKTLTSYVSRLRKVLSPVEVRQRSGGYLLVADRSEIDLYEFRRLRDQARKLTGGEAVQVYAEALALWRGEALTGLDGDWATAERDRLHEERAAVEHDLTDARLALGHAGELLAELAARVTRRPLDERLAGQHMLALYRVDRGTEALEHYRRLRVRLADELGTDPCAALHELHQRILAADPALLTTPARAPVPRQLPSVPASFVGRADLLERLDAELTGPTGIAALVGPGGIGKTWLALHWARRHLDRFPDGQLFVDLRGFRPDGEPMDPAAAIGGFLEALGVAADAVPADPHTRTALFRSLVAGRRMLIVADNAADTGQVVPLLPGGDTCVVLATSRTSLSGLVTGYGAHHVALDVLTGREARDLLTTRLGEERIAGEPAAAELIRTCDGHPLALSIVARHARTRPHLSLTALATELRQLGLDALDSDDPGASLPSVLSWSLRRLTGDQAATFALLGLSTGPDISLMAAASLIDRSPQRTAMMLRGLEHASLLTKDAHGRYRMHGLIHAYATTVVHDEWVREAALRRLLDFYTHTAHAADCLVHRRRHCPHVRCSPPEPSVHLEPLHDSAAATAWFDAEHQHLLAAQRTAATHGLHRTVWRLAWTLSTFHLRRRHDHDELATWQAGLTAAHHLPNPTARTLAHRFLGDAHVRLGQFHEAIEHVELSLAMARRQQDLVSQGHAHRVLARARAHRGEHGRAHKHAALALRIFHTLGTQR